MSVREAVPNDRDAVIGLLRDMHAACSIALPFAFDPAYAAAYFAGHCGRRDRLCLVHAPDGLARGMLFAACLDHPFGPLRLAQESLFWVDPTHRGRAAPALIAAYEAWARAMGCSRACLAHQGGDARPSALYRRRGYVPTETNFWKAL